MERETLHHLLRDMLLCARVRGARRGRIQQGQYRRLPASLSRRGSGRRRRHQCRRSVRLYCQHLPRACPCARARHAGGEVMAELFGRATGMSKGMGGSMHMFDRERRFMGGYAIVGESCPIAVGVAYAIAMRSLPEIGDLLLRRRRREPGRVPRVAEHGRPLAPAGAVRLREQSLRHRHRNPPPFRRAGSFQTRRRLQHPRREDRRHGRAQSL